MRLIWIKTTQRLLKWESKYQEVKLLELSSNFFSANFALVFSGQRSIHGGGSAVTDILCKIADQKYGFLFQNITKIIKYESETVDLWWYQLLFQVTFLTKPHQTRWVVTLKDLCDFILLYFCLLSDLRHLQLRLFVF